MIEWFLSLPPLAIPLMATVLIFGSFWGLAKLFSPRADRWIVLARTDAGVDLVEDLNAASCGRRAVGPTLVTVRLADSGQGLLHSEQHARQLPA